MFATLARLLRGNRDLAVFLGCTALSFSLISLPIGAKETLSRFFAGAVLGPFKRAATAVSELVRVREENVALRKLATELAAERAALVEYKHENERLRDLLRTFVTFPEEQRFEMLPARVVGMPGGRVTERIEIDRGSEHGIRVGMPVVVPEGLVGKVARVSYGRSTVEPLTSATAAVSAVVERTRVRGVVHPRFRSGSELVDWEISYVPARSDVIVGDRVVTSGLGGIYPPGLAIGTVTRVDEGPLTMTIRVRLAVDFATVEQVFVLTGPASGGGGASDVGAMLPENVAAPRTCESEAA